MTDDPLHGHDPETVAAVAEWLRTVMEPEGEATPRMREQSQGLPTDVYPAQQQQEHDQ